MARKKSSAAAATATAARNPDAGNSQTKLEQSRTPHPDAAAAERKLTNLKTLNDILLKQTVELREKENHAADASLLSTFESEIAFLVLSSRLADEQERLKQQAAMEEQLKVVAGEKAEIEKALYLAVSDRDRKTKEVDLITVVHGEKISALVEELRAVSLERDSLEVELIDSRKAWKSAEDDRVVLLDEVDSARVDFDLLKKEKVEADGSFVLKIKDLVEEIDELERKRDEQSVVIASQVEELRSIELVRDRLEAELRNSKYVFDSMKEEMELGRAKVVDELDRVRIDFDLLKKEKEKSEERFETQLDEFKREKGEQDVVISAQAEELQNLALARDQLQATYNLTKEELEQGRAKALSELKRACVNFDILKQEKQQLEQSFKLQLNEMSGQLDAMERESDEQGVSISAQVEEIRNLALAKDRLEAELRSSEEAFHSMKQELEQGRTKALDELKCIQVDFYVLEKEKELSEQSLKSEIKELTGQLSATEREKAEQGVTIAAQVEEIRSLALAKDHLEAELISLRSMNGDLERWHAKVLGELKSIQLNFDALKKEKEQSEERFKLELKEFAKQLDTLTTEMAELVAQKDVIERERAEQQVEIAGLEIDLQQLQSKVSEANGELNAERVKAEGLKLQVVELENRKTSTEEALGRAKTDHEYEIAQLMNKMETEIAGAQKKNGRFFAWFVPAATTATAILAAGLTTYTAKRRTYNS